MDKRPAGTFLTVDGIPHWISAEAGEHLRALEDRFDLVWCTGWEEKANDYLLQPLRLRRPLAYLTFGGPGSYADGHWKLRAIDEYAHRRPVAWIDDDHDSCREWATARPAPTLLVLTDPAEGMTGRHVRDLLTWAEGLEPAPAPAP